MKIKSQALIALSSCSSGSSGIIGSTLLTRNYVPLFWGLDLATSMEGAYNWIRAIFKGGVISSEYGSGSSGSSGSSWGEPEQAPL